MEYEMRSGDTRTKGRGEDDGPVFYNKVQVFNRDLSCVVIALFAQWRYIERAESRARKGLRGAAADEAAAAERSRLYGLTAAELDELLRAEPSNQGVSILDALAATGLRAIRYAKEIPGVQRVVANDLDADAAEACRRNIEANGAASRCEARRSDAVVAMLEAKATGRAAYDVIDIDPYGTCAPFLDAAVQCVADGGLLCVTSTDMAVLSGNYPEVCFSRYGSMPTKAKHLHEFALRVVLHALETAAAKYQRHVHPVLCVSVDFYVRVFVRVFRSPAEVKKSCLKRGYVFQSTGCPTFYLQPIGRPHGSAKGKPGSADKFAPALLHASPSDAARASKRKRADDDADDADAPRAEDRADDEAEQPAATAASTAGDAAEGRPARAEGDARDSAEGGDETVAPAACGETGAPFKIGGPIWLLPLYDRDWVTAALDRVEAGVDRFVSTKERLHGVLTAISEELFDVPLYYTLPDLCSTLHCASPKLAEIKAALTHAGYRCSQSHRDADAVKTDAPPRVVWDVMRCWCVKHPVAEKRLEDRDTAAAKILAKPPLLRANFATTAAMRAKPTKARRWAPNPEEYWGPKAAARGRKRPKHRRE